MNELKDVDKKKKLELISQLIEKYKSVNCFLNKEGTFTIKIIRYRSDNNPVTEKQYKYIKYHIVNKYDSNVSWNNIIRHLSKYSASALISINKAFPDESFYVYC